LRGGEPTEETGRVNQRLEAASHEEDGGPNLRFKSIDPTDELALERLPPGLRKLCQEPAAKRPRYAGVNPRRDLVYAGGLAEADVAALVESPARKQLGQLMAQGNIVLLLLEGKDAAANRAAERAVQDVMGLVAAGRLDELLRADALALGGEAGASKAAG